MPTINGMEVSPAQKDFWERKKAEVKQQQRLTGRESRVTNETMLQGLIDLWMKLEEKEVMDDPT